MLRSAKLAGKTHLGRMFFNYVGRYFVRVWVLRSAKPAGKTHLGRMFFNYVGRYFLCV